MASQLAESESTQHQDVVATPSEGQDRERVEALEAKVKLLEKDLFYYKKTSRDLRKKLQRGKGDGGRETVTKVTSGVRERAENDTVVADFVQVDFDDSLAVSGVSLASQGRGQKEVEHVGGSDDKVGQAPLTSESQQLQVIRKQKKQLRQLR